MNNILSKKGDALNIYKLFSSGTTHTVLDFSNKETFLSQRSRIMDVGKYLFKMFILQLQWEVMKVVIYKKDFAV